MKKQMRKRVLSALLAAGMVCSMVLPANAGAMGVQEVPRVQAADLSANLLAYYDFESASGTSIPNVHNAETYTGSLQGSNVTVTDSDLFGKSLSLGEGTDGYMNIPSIMNAGTTSYSVSLWYKYDTTASRGDNSILVQQSGNGRSFLMLTTGNKYRSFVNQQNVDSNASVDVSKWQWVMISYDSDAKKVRFYINGILDSEKAAGDNEVDALTDIMIGKHKTAARVTRGLIDEIRIYDKVMSEEEALAVYQHKAGPVLFQELETRKTAAQTLYDSGKLESTEAEAVALQAAITAAAAITAQNSYQEIQEAIDSLEAAMVGYQEAAGNTLTVDLEEVQRTLERSTVGINHRYAFNGYGSFDSNTMTMKEEFVELYKDAGFGSIRYPGGTISNLFQWKNTIGDKSERVDQIHGFYNNSGQNGIAPNFGLSEVANFAYAEDVQSEIIYVYGFGRGSAQDAADLVEYLNAPVGCNPNGGVAWAEVRAENGRTEPYDVRHFEIGNENQQAYGIGSDGTASQGYWLDYTGAPETSYVQGGTANVTKQYAVKKDNWNRAVSNSDGTANQVRYMRYANPNPMTGERGKDLVEDFEAVTRDSVHVYVNDVEWNIVESFEDQAADAQVVTVDYRDGSFRFGDGEHGMIPPQNATITVSYSVERDGFIQLSQAMREVTDEINAYNRENNIDRTVECYLYSSYETAGFIQKMAAADADDLWDGFTIHPYSGDPGGQGETFYDNAMLKAEESTINRVKHFVDMMPADKVPVISEYGIFRSTNPLVRSQTHAIYIAKVFMEYVRYNSPYIQKHCLIDWYSSGADSLGPTQQAVIQAVAQEGANTKTGEGEFRFFATPSAKVFEMLKDGMGTEVVGSTFAFEDKLANGTQAVSALVSKDEAGNLYFNIVNTDRTEKRKIILDVTGEDLTGRNMIIKHLVAPSFDAENTLENPENVKIVTTEAVSEEAQPVITINPHTFTVIKIEAPEQTATVPTAPQYLEAFGEEGYAVLSWMAPESDGGSEIIGYEVSYETDVWVQADSLTGHVVENLENGREYTIQVRAINAVGAGESASVKVVPDFNMQVVVPTFTPEGGTYQGAQTVEITTITEGAAIYYTTDGSKPDLHSTEYTGPITVSESMTLKAIGVKEGMKTSIVKTAIYEIQKSEEPDDPKDPVSPDDPKDPVKPDKPWIFSDVSQDNKDHWMYKAVRYVYNTGEPKELMGGVGGTDKFQPNRELERGMVATILHRWQGNPSTTISNPFSDVAAGAYYEKAVIWAYEQGIVGGKGGTDKFAPTDFIQRQEIAKMLYLYGTEVLQLPMEASGDLSSFTDAKAVAGWATEFMKWATGSGIITGKPNDDAKTSYRMDPTGYATRAECAAMIQRFAEKYVD